MNYLVAFLGFVGLLWLMYRKPVTRARRRHHKPNLRDVERYLSGK